MLVNGFTTTPLRLLSLLAALICDIFLNISQVADVFMLIFKEAFSGRAAVGGAEGLAVMHIFKTGIKSFAKGLNCLINLV